MNNRMQSQYQALVMLCGSRHAAALILCNCLIWVIASVIPFLLSIFGLSIAIPPLWLGMSSDFHVVLRHLWTPLTYMVTQFNFLHLLFNMLWLFWFGRLYKLTAKEPTLLRDYFGAGLSGAALYLIYNLVVPGTGSMLCGASAAVLGIMTITAIRLPNLPVRLFLIGEVRLKWVVLTVIILTFLGIGGGVSGAQSAHIGGVLYALAVCFAPRLSAAISHSSISAVSPRRKVPKGINNRLNDHNRLDELLAKISNSGYNSLTRSERRELDAISNRLKNR